MAATVQLYNHTINRFNNGLNAAGDTYKLEWLSSSASFNATHTTKTAVDNAGAYEVYGNGWTQGGIALTSVVLELAATSGGKFDAANIAQAITGGNLGPYSFGFIYNSTDANGPPVAFITLEAPITNSVGTNATADFSASGIITWSVAA